LLLNTFVFLGLIFQVVSGLVISQVLLPFFNIKTINDIKWFSWHAQIALLTILLIGFHLALGLNKILSYFRKRPAAQNERKGKPRISFKVALYRICILCLLSFAVAFLSYLIIGAPSVERIYPGNVIEEFRPNLLKGIVQLLIQVVLVLVTCLVARKWFKISP
jgi:succinate dehydrogenase hydrophobic anchor subunit